MRVLAEIPPRPSSELRTGTLRRSDLEAFGGLLEELGGARTVLAVGSARRAVALGLATAAAAKGLRAVMVECNLAEPTLAESLGLATAPGLHEYLRGEVDATRILKPVVLAGPGSPEAAEPLVCVVAGRPAGDARTLLLSEAFPRAIDGLRSAYDIAVIESWEEYPLDALPTVDSTIACVGPLESRQDPPIAVNGLVIQS